MKQHETKWVFSPAVPPPSPAGCEQTWHSHSGPSLQTGWTCSGRMWGKWRLQTPCGNNRTVRQTDCTVPIMLLLLLSSLSQSQQELNWKSAIRFGEIWNMSLWRVWAACRSSLFWSHAVCVIKLWCELLNTLPRGVRKRELRQFSSVMVAPKAQYWSKF